MLSKINTKVKSVQIYDHKMAFPPFINGQTNLSNDEVRKKCIFFTFCDSKQYIIKCIQGKKKLHTSFVIVFISHSSYLVNKMISPALEHLAQILVTTNYFFAHVWWLCYECTVEWLSKSRIKNSTPIHSETFY